MRRGFTLVELLVAIGVFMLGFSAAFGLFLAAVRYRSLADDTIRLSMTAERLGEQISLIQPDAKAPSAYLSDAKLHPVTDQPGLWYRIESCTDAQGGDDPRTSTLHLRLLVLAYPQAGGDELDLAGVDGAEINRRMRLIEPASGGSWRTFKPGYDQMTAALIRRGMAQRYPMVLLRRPPG